MDFVDLRRRQEERARARRKPETPRRSVTRDRLLFVGTGFVLGSAVSYFYSNVLYTPGISALILLAAMITLVCYFVWLLQRGSAKTEPKLGSEKQLLMAIQDSDGTITPIEAALETSLTVDEAEEILTRFADRGHLRVESRDGALLYALPGRRHTPETRTV